jgi:hypothetical protein
MVKNKLLRYMTTYAYTILLPKPARPGTAQNNKTIILFYGEIFITYGKMQTIFSDFNRCIFHGHYQLR